MMRRLRDLCSTLDTLAQALRDEGHTSHADALAVAARIVDVRFAPGARCPGRMKNSMHKDHTVCMLCHRIDYETNEGDRCPFDLD